VHPPDDSSRITGCKDAAVAGDAVIYKDSTTGRKSAQSSPTGAPPPTRRWLRHYDDGVPVEIQVPPSLPDLLDTAADRWPGSAALCYRGRTTTFRELRREVELLSTALARLSVGRGDRVAVLLPTCPQLVIGLHAVLRLGAVAVPLDPHWPESLLEAALADSGAEVVLCSDRWSGRIAALRDRGRGRLREVVVSAEADNLAAVDRHALPVRARTVLRQRLRSTGAVTPGARLRCWNEELRRARGIPVPATAVAPTRDPAVLLYEVAPRRPRSRTTEVRAAVLTTANLLAAGAQSAAWLTSARPGRELVLLTLPLFTAEALSLGLAAGTMLGAGLLLRPEEGDEAGSAPPVPPDADRPTLLVGPAPLLCGLTDDVGSRAEPAPVDLRAVRLCITDVAAPEELARLARRTDARVLGGLSVPGAATVAAAPVRAGRADDALTPGHLVPLPSTQIRILDERGAPLPIGRPGRLALRGPQVFAGYWRRPKDTRRVLADGWLRTDVQACLHPHGWLEVIRSPDRQP
jgi:long-chain acyl-CoA synthetase